MDITRENLILDQQRDDSRRRRRLRGEFSGRIAINERGFHFDGDIKMPLVHGPSDGYVDIPGRHWTPAMDRAERARRVDYRAGKPTPAFYEMLWDIHLASRRKR